MLRVLEVCGEASAAGTPWLSFFLDRAGPVHGASLTPYLRPQLLRFVVEAFWQIHFDSKHPMQRRMVVVPLFGQRRSEGRQAALLKVIQPEMENPKLPWSVDIKNCSRSDWRAVVGLCEPLEHGLRVTQWFDVCSL